MTNLSETELVPLEKTPTEKVKDLLNRGFDVLDEYEYFRRSFKEAEVWAELIKFNKQQDLCDFFSGKVDFLKVKFSSLKYKRYGKNILIDSIHLKKTTEGVNLIFHFYYQNKPSSQMISCYDPI